MILGLDISPSITGWCKGDGSAIPECGAFALSDWGTDYGSLVGEFDGYLKPLLDGVTHVVPEAPILRQHDVLHTLIRIYGLYAHLLFMCRGIACQPEDLRKVKTALTGDPFAPKEAMVAAARRCGLTLPKGEAAKDAADAFGCWECGVRRFAPRFIAHWDGVIRRQRGALL